METDLRELFAEKVSSLDVPSDMPVATERRVRTRRSMIVTGAAVCLLIAVAAAISWGEVFDTSSPVRPAGQLQIETLPDGLLEPGTYSAEQFVEPFEFTVVGGALGDGGLAARGIPGAGAATASIDSDARIFMLRDGLTPSRLLFVQPFEIVRNLGAGPLNASKASAEDWAQWFAVHPALEDASTSDASIDGRDAIRVNARVRTLNGLCGCASWHAAFHSGNTLLFDDGWTERFYVLEGADGPLVFLIEAPNKNFDSFADRAEAILGTLHFN